VDLERVYKGRVTGQKVPPLWWSLDKIVPLHSLSLPEEGKR